MRYRFAWDEFSVLLHLWACKNRECSERPTLHRPTFEISDGGGVCSFFLYIRTVICNSFFWWIDIVLYSVSADHNSLSFLLLPIGVWKLFFMSRSLIIIATLHCTVSVHKIFFLDYWVYTKYSWLTLCHLGCFQILFS
jgi:hypothetical protein